MPLFICKLFRPFKRLLLERWREFEYFLKNELLHHFRLRCLDYTDSFYLQILRLQSLFYSLFHPTKSSGRDSL